MMGWVAFWLLLAWLAGVVCGALVCAWALHPFLCDCDTPHALAAEQAKREG